ncbi:MAG: bifunctional nicotinamidase/pyrazinamidase [Spirochaetaceae bacterium]|nr:MAG: bifunctional nicotinamidase/pyrazinamidase [Spirochaetaceae bacterium]
MVTQNTASRAALLVIDAQRDFCPGGNLAVADGDAVVPVINQIAPRFGYVVATRDWHPAEHGSFASLHPGAKPFETGRVGEIEQVLWPDHCVQGTPGADFHPDLDQRPIRVVLHKGFRPTLDSYSAFFENDHRTATGLDALLRGLGYEELFFCGIATDVCVLFSVLDALRLGYRCTLVEDACRGVDRPSGAVASAIDRMRTDGCSIIASSELAP